MALPMFDADLHYSKEPIAYYTFLSVIVTSKCHLNAVLLPIVDPVHGPILQLKATVPLKAGNLVKVSEMRRRFQRLNWRS